MKLREVGEDRLLERLPLSFSAGKGVLVGAGDDCAVVRSPGRDKALLLKTDCVVEKIHFESTADPIRVGWKAMMRPLSDFAAMSGVPQFALITLVVSSERKMKWVDQLYRGLRQAAERFDVSIVGGETSSIHGPAMISVSVAGFVEKERAVSRRGAKAGDDLFVTGRLGGSIRGKHLRFLPRIDESRWLTGNFSLHAMIDLSDGLGVDLPRLARASRVGFEVDENFLPLNPGASIQNAISDGEDYELLFALAPRQRAKLQRAWRRKFAKLPLTRIGRLTSNVKNWKSNRKNRLGGYVHFQ